MTASKSSRARNARAAAARTPGGTAVKNATARNGAASGRGTAGKNGAARNETARNGVAGRNGTAVTDGGRGPGAGRGAREQAAEVSAALAGPAPWLQATTFLLALAGLGVSIYLTIAHFTETPLAGCSESGLVNCTKVTTSPQSYVFGIPVAVLGLAFYLFAAAAMSPWAWQAARREVHLVRLASMVVGMGFVLDLVYAELFLIGSICLYCTSVHVLTFVLFVLTAFAAAAWGLRPGAAWKGRFIPLRAD